jgi:ribonuclease VapC
LIILDTSAIFAVLYPEPLAAVCNAAIAANDSLAMSAGTYAEAQVVAAGKGLTTELGEYLSQFTLEIVPVDAATAAAVGRAYAQWGKGLHRASLNFGDCFAYALARERQCPLLFIGNDFSQTDVASALQ